MVNSVVTDVERGSSRTSIIDNKKKRARTMAKFDAGDDNLRQVMQYDSERVLNKN